MSQADNVRMMHMENEQKDQRRLITELRGFVADLQQKVANIERLHEVARKRV